MSLLDKPFRIEFTNPEKIFVPGDVVDGRIIFHWVSQVKAVQGITAKLRCCGKIHSGKVLVDSLFEQTYYSKKQLIFGDGVHWIQVPRGGSYTFRFTLPQSGLPQSFVGNHGCIKYLIQVSATVKIKRLGAIRVEGDEQFGVNDVRVLSDESIGGPFEMLFDDARSFRIRRSLSTTTNSPSLSPAAKKRHSDTKIKLNLNKKGFIPGEFIQFSIQVVNESRKVLPAATVQFQQVVKYIAPHLTRQDVNTLGKCDGSPIGSNGISCWESCFEVPDVPISSPTNSPSCILISYRLKVEIVTSPLTRNLRYYCPVLIGSAPNEFDSELEAAPVNSRAYSRQSSRASVDEEEVRQRDEERQLTSSCPPGPCPCYSDISAVGNRGSFISIGPPPSYEDVMRNLL